MGCCDMRGGLVEEFTADSFYVQGTADRLFALPPSLPEGVSALSLGTCSLVPEPGASA